VDPQCMSTTCLMTSTCNGTHNVETVCTLDYNEGLMWKLTRYVASTQLWFMMLLLSTA